ncbi:hypothetical protein O1611_g3891 [Lasiodiplodia mahajangana]|uniref:Uncharacterized protein n=1 Tax=Lasiodiplodia mahajangana TaxID=1108764 RepID=A0ACC2JQV7_9PEZI|nr:hypothetical protein O1611_g3891 [Lasiodiplodia mahajangana]
MSADLFAAFEDFSQPSQQSASKPSSTQPVSTPLSFTSPEPSQQWGQSSTSNQFQHQWHTTQPSIVNNVRPTSVATSSFANIHPIDNGDTGDDDGWGDFEVAPDTAFSSAPPQATPVTYDAADTRQPIPATTTDKKRTRIVRASTLDLVSNSLVDFEGPSTELSQPRKPPIPPVQPSSKSQGPKRQINTVNVDPNVLFDADDFDGEQDGGGSDDDFGEFETVPPLHQPSSDLSSTLFAPSSGTHTAKKASELLLDLDINDPTPKPSQATKTNLIQPQAASLKQGLSTPKPYAGESQPRSIQANPKPQTLEDDWDPFSDWPKQPAKSQAKTAESTWDWDSVEPPKTAEIQHPIKQTPAPQSNEATTQNEDTAWDWDPVDMKAEDATEIEDSALPPINIPPPSILLSVFPQLFEQANEYLYKPMSGQSQSIKDRILSDTRTHDFLRGFLSLAVVAARIIAGRRMRWHRDKFLSQSMSISAAGSKGMKLAGVDKAQTAREDREATDVVGNWKGQVGRLRSTVASANSARKNGGKPLKIPEITDTMQVQTARDVPTAPKACVICGLKRNERLAKVDYEVEDSFGEWWVEHWGHVACKRFWLQHESTLRQR